MINIPSIFAATPNCDQSKFLDNFFGIPTWYKYLELKYSNTTKKCEIDFKLMDGGTFSGADILRIGLGVIDILIHIAALVAVAFVMYGGIKYITSQGSPDGTKSAQNTILNGLIGLAIAVIAAAVVSFLGKSIN